MLFLNLKNLANNRFLRPRYVAAGRTSNFSFGFIPKKTTSYEEMSLTLISQTGYISNINGLRNKEEIFKHWKRVMHSVLNLNTIWATENFLNNIKHSFSGTTVNWYESLNEEEKHTLRIVEVPEAMFKRLCKEIKIEFIGAKLDFEEKNQKVAKKHK